MIQIAVASANGRVGQLIVSALDADNQAQKKFKLTAKILKSDAQNPLEDKNCPIDVLIDFTNPKTTLENLKFACARKIKMVIGTTGFTEAEKNEIAKASSEIAIVFAPNMSVGVNLSFKLLETVAAALKEPVSVKISDLHHQHKKDAPSGTALKMAEIIKEAQQKNAFAPSIEFSSERRGEIVGDHSAVFNMAGESIEITHRSSDRSLYAKGALQAAEWLTHQGPGLYDMQEVLELRAKTNC